ncbi:MAG: hypothetical protein HQL22_05840 [Candidatus Omnitrophica bacterium]|nr:hypothetical protein [Candidatus Omnitrophota bacterium]
MYFHNTCLFLLADGCFYSSMIPLAHIPTLLLLVGYPVYWLELYSYPHPTGHTSWLATLLFMAAAVFVCFRHQGCIRRPQLPMWFLIGAGSLAGVMILLALLAALLPPHLSQEFDALNYHITFPRQHLILGSFAHIPWSTADLYFSPQDYALAPFWLSTSLPNKWPQLVFFFGLLMLVYRLTCKAGASDEGGWLAVAAVFGCHVFVIQAGIAMLDVAICYCFFAALDSFREGRFVLAAVEMAFCFWAKSFMPVLMGALVLGVILLCGLIRGRLGASVLFYKEGSALILRKFMIAFIVVSIFVAGPFAARSFVYGATPLFPLFAGSMNVLRSGNPANPAVIQKAQEAMNSRDSYGMGRGPVAFLEHIFLIAVPTRGVNNPYDYPVGLTYLLFMGPFMWAFVEAFRKKKVMPEMIFIVLFWLLWWFGSQQSRFLIIPLVLLFVIMAALWKRPSRMVLFCVLVAMAFEVLSMFRAHQPDLGKSSWDVLRPQDRAWIEQAKGLSSGATIVTDKFDVAFAPFAVDVHNNPSVFVIKY